MKTFRFLAASAIGTYFEFLDFMLFTFAAPIIAFNFFPKGDPALALIYTWGIFFVGFLVRPIGALFFGHIGDKLGSRYSLLISMGLMSVATISMGFLPAYERLGIFAPLCLMLLRAMQGFAFSAEYTGPSTYLSLNSRKNLGLLSSITIVAMCLGQLSGSQWISVLTSANTVETLPEWKWRMPFIISGILVGGVGILLRLNMPNLKPPKVVRVPFLSLMKSQKKETLVCIFLAMFVGIKSYALFGYLPPHLQKFLGIPMHESLNVASTATLVMMFSTLFAGWLSDKIGRARVLHWSLIGMGIAALFAFRYIQDQNASMAFLWIYILAFGSGTYSGAIPALLAEVFKQEQRFSGSALSYNIGVSIGGATPLIMAVFSRYNQMIPGYFIAACSVIIMLILYFANTKRDFRIDSGIVGSAPVR